MATVPKKSAAEGPPSQPEPKKVSDLAAASVPDTLIALRVNPDTGLNGAEVDTRRKEHGYNEVARRCRNFAMRRVASPEDIFPVFHELFSADSAAA